MYRREVPLKVDAGEAEEADELDALEDLVERHALSIDVQASEEYLRWRGPLGPLGPYV